MILEDFSDIENIENIKNNNYIDYEINLNDILDKNKDEQNIDFSVDNDNNLIISLNLTKNIIKNIKKNSIVKLEFQLSKEFYLSILEDFR